MNDSAVVWWRPGHYVLFGIMFIESVLTLATNSMLILTIITDKSLRNKKEFVVVFSVALADWIYGFSMSLFTANLIFSFVSGGAAYAFTRLECLFSIVPILMAFGLGYQGPALLFQSIDRLVAISMPLYYFGVTARVSWRWSVAVLGCSAVQTALLVWDGLDTAQNTIYSQSACLPQTAFKENAVNLWIIANMIPGPTSVVLFGIVLLLYRKHMKTVAPDTQRELKEHMATQIRVTASMGMSCWATLGLYVMPRIINTVILQFTTNRTGHLLFRALAIVLYSLNPILNFFIYYRRHESIRNGFKYIFKKKNQVSPQNRVVKKQNEKTLTAVKVDKGLNVDAKHILVRAARRGAGEHANLEHFRV